MKVFVSQGKRVPISTSVESHQSRTGCHDAERICEESILPEFVDEVEKTQQHNVNFNYNAGSVDIFAKVDREGLLRKFFAVKEKRPDYNTSSYVDPMLDDSLDAGPFQVSNTQSEMYCDILYINKNSKQTSVQEKSSGPSEELQLLISQAQQQQQMNLALQKELYYLTELHQQQNRQTLLKEKEKLQKEAQVAQDSAVKETVSTRMQSENAEYENASMKNLPPLCVCHQLNSRQLEDVQPHMRQRIQKRMTTRSNVKIAADVEPTRQLRKVSRILRQTDRVEKSEGSLPKKKRVRSKIHAKRSNFAAEMDPRVLDQSKTNSCSECGKQYYRKDHLIRHLIIHTGEKPFKCVECAVAFSRKDSLTRHQMIHSDEKSFSCDICKRFFRRKEHLSSHMNTHNGRKPHKCNVCKKTFCQRSGLCRHRKVHAKEEPVSNF